MQEHEHIVEQKIDLEQIGRNFFYFLKKTWWLVTLLGILAGGLLLY